MNSLRYAVRMLLKTPGTTAVAILALALAIGAGTAIFSAVNGVLLRPLPYPQPDRLVHIFETHARFPKMFVSYANFLDWQRESKTFESIAATRNLAFNLTSTQPPQRMDAKQASASLPQTLGFQLPLGRFFSADEDLPGGAKVAVLSHELWTRSYDADPGVLGKTVQLNGLPYTVIGVMPKGFDYAGATDLWVPLGQMDENARRRNNHPGTYAVGRLAPGATFQQARDEMLAIGTSLGERYPETRTVLPGMTLLEDEVVKGIRPTLWVLLAAVGFVLLIATANVANLMLARGVARRKELAVRAALGAPRSALIRQLLLESLMIALVGGALGVLIGWWSLDFVGSDAPDGLPAVGKVQIDATVLAFTLLCAVGAGLAFGIAPALAGARVSVLEAMKDGDARSGEAAGNLRLRRLLVVAEIAIALILLVGAGVTLRAFLRLNASDPGFDTQGVTTAQVALTPAAYPDAAKLRAFMARIEEGARALPGVQAVAIASTLPLTGSSENSFAVQGRPPPVQTEIPFASYLVATPGYFEAMGIEVIAGRAISAEDVATSQPVVMIDDHMVRDYFQGQDPLGQVLTTAGGNRPRRIVGVVRHVSNYSIDGVGDLTQYQYYEAAAQQADADRWGLFGGFALVIRGASDTETYGHAVRDLVRRNDALAAVFAVVPMSEYVDRALASRRLASALLGLFAAFAFVLAVVGLYAVMAFAVTQRTHEIGVRMALGAQAKQVEGMMVRMGAQLAGFGLAVGLLAAIALSRVVAGLLPGVDASDPLLVTAMAAVLAAAALLASYLPARRAARVDPMRALKAD